MKISLSPLVMSLLDGDTYPTATQVRLTRGNVSQDIPVAAILPSQNAVALPEETVKREIIIRAWQLCTTTAEGDQPMSLTSPAFRQFVNVTNGNNLNLYSGLGRLYLGDIDQTATGWRVRYGLSLATPSNEIEILADEFYAPGSENGNPIEPVIPLISAYLRSRDANAVAGEPLVPGGPNVTILTAERLYAVFLAKVNSYDFPYFVD